MDYMQVTMFAGGVTFVLVAVLVFLFTSSVSIRKSVWKGVGCGVIAGFFASVVTSMVTGVWLSVQVPDNTFIQAPDGAVTGVFGKHESWYPRELWKWDDRLPDGARIVSYATDGATYAMNTSPITENPRVLLVRLVVSVERFGTVDDYIAHHDAIGDTTLSVWLESQMLDFYAEHSRDIAHWQNHHYHDQQEQCRELIHGFLEPRLARIGGRFKEARFRVAM